MLDGPISVRADALAKLLSAADVLAFETELLANQIEKATEKTNDGKYFHFAAERARKRARTLLAATSFSRLATGEYASDKEEGTGNGRTGAEQNFGD